MYQKCLISVIVPIYNISDYLERCLSSLVLQTYQHIEIILIDDGSYDDSLSICKRYAENDNRFFVYSKENEGVTLARKFGLNKSMGDFIIFCDGDDSLPVNAVELLYNNLNKYDADIAIGGTNMIQGDFIQRVDNKVTGLLCKNEYIKSLLNLGVNYGPNVKIYKRNLLNNFPFGLPSEITNYEDLFANIAISLHVNKVYISNELAYNYYVREGSASFNVMPYQLWCLLLTEIRKVLGEYINAHSLCQYFNNLAYRLIIGGVILKFQKTDKSFNLQLKSLFYKNRTINTKLLLFSTSNTTFLRIYEVFVYVKTRFCNLIYKINRLCKRKQYS